MQKHTTIKRKSSSSRHLRLPLLLTIAAFALVLLSVFITFTFRSQATPVQHTIFSKDIQQQQSQFTVATYAPTQVQGRASTQVGTQVPTSTPVQKVQATPTLIPSTPQSTQYGVFPLSAGGPLPVPESILHPTNIARTMLSSTLISVYAGSMTHNSQVGILCVLREDVTTGQVQIKMYQTPQERGALTILALQKNILTITDSTKVVETFDLNTNQFH